MFLNKLSLHSHGSWFVVRGSWFDKLTMRESVDATIIADISDHKHCRSKRLQRKGCRTWLPCITPLPHGELVEPHLYSDID
ncbi:hypothetical protein SAMN05443582_1021025 [Phyllobacterium sp. OV277]|nr:hypothetical protein SAMN05443582_1021025 [Phyllobacterium sp. OV277]